MSKKYERVDLGNVRGKTGEDGKDGTGISQIVDDGFTGTWDHNYRIVYDNENKEPFSFTVKDGSNLALDTSVKRNSQKAVTGGALYNKFLTKSDITHHHRTDEVMMSEKQTSTVNGQTVTTYTETDETLYDKLEDLDDELLTFVKNNDARLTDKRNIKVTDVTPTSTTNLNNYTTAGLYTFFDNTAVNSINSTNKAYLPSNLENKSFFLLVESKDTNATYVKQTLTRHNDGKTWVRIKNSSTWSEWTELSIVGHTHSYNDLTNKLAIQNAVDDVTANKDKLVTNKGIHDYVETRVTEIAEIVGVEGNIPSAILPKVNTEADGSVCGTGVRYAREDHQHTYTNYIATGTNNTDGYVKVMQMTIGSGNHDHPITFKINQRGLAKPITCYLKFNDTTGADPAMSSFIYDAQTLKTYVSGESSTRNPEVYLYKEGTSVWSIIVKKMSPSDKISVSFLESHQNITFTGLDTQINTLPITNIWDATGSYVIATTQSYPFDLNDYTRQGTYYVTGTDTANGAHMPLSNVEFVLNVDELGYGSYKYIKQTFTTLTVTPRVYYRVYVGHERTGQTVGWTDWIELTNSQQINMEYVSATHSAGTNNWTATCTKINKLERGVTIFFYLNQVPTTDGATMTLTLADGTVTESKNIWIREGVRLTDQFPQYTVFCLGYNGNTWRVVNGIVPESTSSNITMNGTRSAGTSPNYARADHVHPTDTTRASTSVATTNANGLLSSSDKTKIDNIGKHLTNENIDELLTQGLYWVDTNSHSLSGTLPIQNDRRAFSLIVDGGGRTVRQIATLYKDANNTYTARTFVRMYSGYDSNLGWSDWKELAFKDHTHGSITNTGTLDSNTNNPYKVVVTDRNNNIKTMDYLPYDMMNITKEYLTSLGLLGTVTYTNGTLTIQ